MFFIIIKILGGKVKIKKVLNNYIIVKNIDVFKPENKKYDVNDDFDKDVGYILESNDEEFRKNDIIVYNSKNAKVTDLGFLLKGSQEVAILREDICYKLIEIK